MSEQEQLQKTIEERIAGLDPAIELILLERPAPAGLRLYIDHPGGVDLALCERVTVELRDLLEAYSLEVSSPGIERPLTKPEHFRRFLGRTVKVRSERQIDGQRNFTGTLAEADDEAIRLAIDAAVVRIPLAEIRRANLVAEWGGSERADRAGEQNSTRSAKGEVTA
jgi:ribosome maturation factor RimP